MRISDDRYSRDRSRFDIAVQFIRHEARTHTIRTWTGLSDDRIRKLYRSYLSESHGAPLTRHRGKSPQQVAFFMRSGRARQEEVGNIRASDAQDQTHQRQQDIQRLRVGPPQAVETARACPDHQSGNVLFPALRIRRSRPLVVRAG